MEALTREFRDVRLPAEAALFLELDQALAAAPADATATLACIRHLAHRLSGAAATFSEPAISEAAGALADTVRALTQAGTPPGGASLEAVRKLIGELCPLLQRGSAARVLPGEHT